MPEYDHPAEAIAPGAPADPEADLAVRHVLEHLDRARIVDTAERLAVVAKLDGNIIGCDAHGREV